MKIFRTLIAKIVLSHCLVGGLSVALVTNEFFQFRLLENELSEQHVVVVFYDAVRHARRLEKNFLLYHHRNDLNEAIKQANFAQATFERIPRTTFVGDGNNDSELESIALYPRLLVKLMDAPEGQPPSPELLKETYAAGSALIQLGERIDFDAQEKLRNAVQQHDKNLIRAILAAVILSIVVGIIVTRSVLHPLSEVGRNLKKIAKGEVERVDEHNAVAEVESLTRSINDTLQELEIRQATQARSSRLMALGTMLSGVAHELNNPLSNISSSCQILEEEWNELPDQQVRRMLKQIDGQVLRAQNIVAELLAFSAKQPLKRQPENVRDLVQDSLLLLTNQMPSGMKILIDIDATVWIKVDRSRFQQVLLNIIRNAAEATPPDGTIRIAAKRDISTKGSGTTLLIEDNGEGIATEHLKKVFDPFFTAKEFGKGTGLGLFVAHEIISRHGGLIRVESQLGFGTKFWMHVPDGTEEGEEH